MSLADEANVRELIALALREDLGSGDLTASLLPQSRARGTFSLVAREPGVLCGAEVAEGVLRAYDESIIVEWATGMTDAAAWHDTPATLATVIGPVGPVLSAERVMLNFLQHLCGIATTTRAYVEAIAHTGASIFNTRKTTPGWRTLEKYAVRCGGGCNHRHGLHDAVLIKDNHLAGLPVEQVAACVFEMLNRLHQSGAQPDFVEVEADTLEQLAELFKVVGIDVVLLDNFSLEDLSAAVALRDGQGLTSRVELEASGGITLSTVEAVARTGVDRISVGALTHSVAALDLSLERI